MAVARYGWAKNLTVIYVYENKRDVNCRCCMNCRHCDSSDKSCCIKDVRFKGNGIDKASRCKDFENGVIY